MARTPLLRSLKKLATECRMARNHGLPLHVLREQRQQFLERKSECNDGLTRREFLMGLGAAAAATTLPRLVKASRREDPKIVIVGGGIAGLTCALGLADQGIESKIYEASHRIGGRMFSNNKYWNDGQVSEWCGELIDSGHFTIQALAQRFGLQLDDLLAAQPAGSEDTYYLFGNYYPKAQADIDFMQIFDVLMTDVNGADYPTTYDSYTPAGKTLDKMSLYDWIETRIPGGHGSPLGQLLDVAYVIEYGADATEQSALNLIYLLGYQPDPSAFSMFGESDEQFHIRGGNQQLPLAIAKYLGVEETIELGKRLVRIRQTPAGRYRLWFEDDESTEEVVADAVVLAVPFAVLRDVDYKNAGFDKLKHKAIQQLGRGRNGKLQLQFNNRYWNQNGPWPGISNGSSYTDTGYQSSWEVSRAQSGTSGIFNFYSGGTVTSNMITNRSFVRAPYAPVLSDAANALGQAEPVFPGLTEQWNGKATQSLPHHSRYFKASYSFYRVGQYTSFGGYEGVRQDSVFFCGEHTSTDYQGYMEGGASEGARVAEQIGMLVKRRNIS